MFQTELYLFRSRPWRKMKNAGLKGKRNLSFCSLSVIHTLERTSVCIINEEGTARKTQQWYMHPTISNMLAKSRITVEGPHDNIEGAESQAAQGAVCVFLFIQTSKIHHRISATLLCLQRPEKYQINSEAQESWGSSEQLLQQTDSLGTQANGAKCWRAKRAFRRWWNDLPGRKKTPLFYVFLSKTLISAKFRIQFLGFFKKCWIVTDVLEVEIHLFCFMWSVNWEPERIKWSRTHSPPHDWTLGPSLRTVKPLQNLNKLSFCLQMQQFHHH